MRTKSDRLQPLARAAHTYNQSIRNSVRKDDGTRPRRLNSDTMPAIDRLCKRNQLNITRLELACLSLAPHPAYQPRVLKNGEYLLGLWNERNAVHCRYWARMHHVAIRIPHHHCRRCHCLHACQKHDTKFHPPRTVRTRIFSGAAVNTDALKRVAFRLRFEAGITNLQTKATLGRPRCTRFSDRTCSEIWTPPQTPVGGSGLGVSLIKLASR